MFGIDIAGELEGVHRIAQCRCLDSGLIFYQPLSVAGSPQLYGQLCRFDWYYQPRKWEHDVALRFCRGRRSLLEVGCGSGAFLRRVTGHLPGIEAVGLEVNPAVTPEGAELFTLRHGDLKDFSSERGGEFGVVCSFQVLEHATDPLSFIGHCCSLAETGGLVLFGTPDADSFIKHSHNLLDLPPHHMSGWSREAYGYLPRVAPLRLLEIIHEPLASYHVDYYLDTWAGYFERQGAAGRFLCLSPLRNFWRVALLAGVRNLVRGQSILAVYEKL